MGPESMLGWHFAETSRRLRYGDGREIVVGKSHSVGGEPILCKHGLHASESVLDALKHAPGPILYRVKLSGKILRGGDKAVATKRAYLAEIDAEPILREFARKCALSVIHLWDAPRVVRQYLETGDESLRDAAGSAAKAAAEAATWAAAAAAGAAWAAAGAAAWDAWAAARAAAGAARDATWAAAWAAWAAAEDAAGAARAAAWDAAGAAAGDARDAAWAAQKTMLEEMCLAALKKKQKRKAR